MTPICVGGVADHVLVCSLGRTLNVATLVAKLKVSSNLAVRERYLSRFSWQDGYAAFSVSESTVFKFLLVPADSVGVILVLQAPSGLL